MSDLYSRLKKQNNKIIKELPLDYSYEVKPLIKSLRKYGSKTDNTEYQLNLLLKDMKEKSISGIKYSSYKFNRDIYDEYTKLITPNEKIHVKFNLKEKIIIAVFLIVFIGFAVVQIVLALPVKFDQVSNVKIVGNELIFDEVDYGRNYKITIYSESDTLLYSIELDDNKEANTNSLNLNSISEISQTGKYYIYIQVMSSELYSASKVSGPFEFVRE